MAGTLTHFMIGKEVYKKLNISLDKETFLLAVQGHDLLYFIKLRELPKFEKIKEKSKVLQEQKFADLVLRYLESIKNNNDDIILKSFLYGYIVHHLTDSIIHPFIIYESDICKKVKHEMLESLIDKKLVGNVNKICKEVPKVKASKKLLEVNTSLFQEIYHDSIIGKTLTNNMNNVRNFMLLYRRDFVKIKRLGYRLIDKVRGSYYEFLSYSYPKKYLDKVDLRKKVEWYDPVTKEKQLTSIMELYQKCADNSLELIRKIESNTYKRDDFLISAVTGKIKKDI